MGSHCFTVNTRRPAILVDLRRWEVDESDRQPEQRLMAIFRSGSLISATLPFVLAQSVRWRNRKISRVGKRTWELETGDVISLSFPLGTRSECGRTRKALSRFTAIAGGKFLQ